MDFGLFHTVQKLDGEDRAQVFRDALAEAVRAEELGFSSVWFTEHHFSKHGTISDSLLMLAHLAARTSRIRLGTAVAVLPFHNPVRIAESAAMLDVLSGGRLDFGVGRGYQWSEFNGFQVGMDDRGERFDEALEVVLKAWTSRDGFLHEGNYWKYGSITVEPQPVQAPHPPVWVATDSEAGLRRCVAEGFGVLLPQGNSLSVVEQQVQRYRRVLDEAGVAFDPSKLALARAIYVADTDDEACAVANPNYAAFLSGAIAAAGRPGGSPPPAQNPFGDGGYADIALFGSPDTVAEHLERVRAIGVEQVLCFVRFQHVGHERIMNSLELFSKEVAPRLQPSTTPATG